MNSDKERRKLAKKLMNKVPGPLKEIDLTNVPYIPKGMTRAFRNNRYTVMIYDNTQVSTGFATKVLIQQLDDLPIKGHWFKLQFIKNEIFGEETTAIEYYPAQSELIDDHNIYWLWIFPDNVLPKPIWK